MCSIARLQSDWAYTHKKNTRQVENDISCFNKLFILTYLNVHWKQNDRKNNSWNEIFFYKRICVKENIATDWQSIHALYSPRLLVVSLSLRDLDDLFATHATKKNNHHRSWEKNHNNNIQMHKRRYDINTIWHSQT